jgi:Zn-dependent protease with chaperone function
MRHLVNQLLAADAHPGKKRLFPFEVSLYNEVSVPSNRAPIMHEPGNFLGMASKITSNRPVSVREFRYPGELISLILTLLILITLYTLAIFFITAYWLTFFKTLLVTLVVLVVYIVGRQMQQRVAFGSLVRVSPRQFPELHQLVVRAAERLSSPYVQVYVQRASEMNIYTLGLPPRPLIVLTSSLVEQMEPDSLQFLIGREIGHVQAGHAFLQSLLKPLSAKVPIIGRVIFGDWVNRTEFTADRAGLIACCSLTIAVSTMLKFGVGLHLYEKLDITEFLEQINDVRNVRGHLTEIVTEQPYLTQRIKALIRYSFSEKFKNWKLGFEKEEHTKDYQEARSAEDRVYLTVNREEKEEYTKDHQEAAAAEPASRSKLIATSNQSGSVLEIGKSLRVFLCHASEDKEAVRNLWTIVRSWGHKPWLDEEDILPGQDWDLEITRAVKAAEVILICLSDRSEKKGYVQKEIKRALDIADEQPEGSIFIIPVRLTLCSVPDRLKRWQWVDLFAESGTRKLEAALCHRALKSIEKSTDTVSRI